MKSHQKSEAQRVLVSAFVPTSRSVTLSHRSMFLLPAAIGIATLAFAANLSAAPVEDSIFVRVPANASVPAAQSTDIGCPIHNRGTVDQTVSIAVSAASAGWSVLLVAPTSPVAIAAGSAVGAVVRISAPFGAVPGDTCVVTLEAAGIRTSVAVCNAIVAGAATRIRPMQSVGVNAARSAVFSATAYNSGTIAEVADLSVSVSDLAWAVSFQQPMLPVSLSPGDSVVKSILVSAPSSALPGSSVLVTVRTFGARVETAVCTLTVLAHTLGVSAPATSEVTIGDSVDLAYVVRNTAELPELLFLNSLVDQMGWSVAVVSPEIPNLMLNGGDSAVVVVRVKAGQFVAPEVPATVTLRAMGSIVATATCVVNPVGAFEPFQTGGSTAVVSKSANTASVLGFSAGSGNVRLSVPSAGRVSIRMLSLDGRLMWRADEAMAAGEHVVGVPSGISSAARVVMQVSDGRHMVQQVLALR